jgi:hypothetical protein
MHAEENTELFAERLLLDEMISFDIVVNSTEDIVVIHSQFQLGLCFLSTLLM